MSLSDLLHRLTLDWFSTRLCERVLLLQELTGKANYAVFTCIDFQQPPLLLLSLPLFTLCLLLCCPRSPLFLLHLPLPEVLFQCLLQGRDRENVRGGEKKKRKHDGLLSGVNYNSAKPVKEGGSSQTLMKSLSGTTKIRWSFLAALWFKSSETKKKPNFISLNSETRLMRLMEQWSRNQEKLMITSNSVLWLWVVAT